MQRSVFVTGGSGFVGSAVIDELLSRHHQVTALARGDELDAKAGVRVVRGDLLKPASYAGALAGCDAVIHLVGIIMEKPSRGVTFQRIHVEGARSIVKAAQSAGVKRYVHMSALGTRAGAAAEYHRTKYEAEQIVRRSNLDWTIFRPSMIHGPRGAFMKMEAMWARGKAPAPIFFMPFMPYFGGGFLGRRGAGRLQPVYVKDVARALIDAMENDATIGEIYPLGGTQTMSWPQLHQTVAEQLRGKRRATAAIPVWLGKFYAAIGLGPILGFNRDQVLMSQEDNVTDLTKFTQDFGWTPAGFTETFASYASRL